MKHRCSMLRQAPGITPKQTRRERPARDTHTSLLQTFINYARKFFYKIGLPGANVIKLFTAVFYYLNIKLECFSLASFSSLV